MIRIPGEPGKDLCDKHLGVTRRDILRIGGSGLLGLSLGGAMKLMSDPTLTVRVINPVGKDRKSTRLNSSHRT